MTPHQIEQTLRLRFDNLKATGERFQTRCGDHDLIVVADGDTDRLRIMMPVAAVDRDDAMTFRRLLEANFSSALDARYAIFNGVLWALYLAPLSSLTTHQVDCAVTQVIELARSTGTCYTANPALVGAGFTQLH